MRGWQVERHALGAEQEPPIGDLGIDQVHARRADEIGRELVSRIVEERRGRARLHDAPVAHQDDAVGERHCLALVMRDVDRRRAELLLDVPELPAHLLAELLIDRRERLVEQKHVGVAHHGTRERRFLPGAGRQYAGIAVEDVIEREDARHPLDFRRSISLRASPRARSGKAMFSRIAEMWVERYELEDHGDVARARGQVR